MWIVVGNKVSDASFAHHDNGHGDAEQLRKRGLPVASCENYEQLEAKLKRRLPSSLCFSHHLVDQLKLLANVEEGDGLDEKHSYRKGDDQGKQGQKDPRGSLTDQSQAKVGSWKKDKGKGEPGKHRVALSALEAEACDVLFAIVVKVADLAAVEAARHIMVVL